MYSKTLAIEFHSNRSNTIYVKRQQTFTLAQTNFRIYINLFNFENQQL